MTDLISRQAALDAFGLSEKTRKWGGDHSGYDTMMLYEIQDTLEDLPSVNPQKWIPVSERLPDDGETYLICTDEGYIATIMYDRSMGWLLGANIIAYMPLPEPFKEVE